jgi:hypothetical protein
LGDGIDVFTIVNVTEAVQHLLVRARGEDDKLYFEGLVEEVVANVYGGSGDDTVWIDGTKNFTYPPMNLLEESRLRWSGGLGYDTMFIKLSSLGSSNIDIFNDVKGINDVNIACTDADTVMLSRENFLANIHNISDSNSTVERINLIREVNDTELSGWRDTASINTIFIRLNEGENEMYFDDTFAPLDIFGGSSVDGKDPLLLWMPSAFTLY